MIRYIIGDATNPIGDGHKIICHVCNDIGGWGSGFVLALSKKWPEPEDSYRRWAQTKDNPNSNFKLGEVMFNTVDQINNIHVANMIAQRSTISKDPNSIPIKYDALKKCLNSVGIVSKNINDHGKEISIHMPRIGCGLAGGNWDIIEKIIKRELGDYEVCVYTLAGDTSWEK